MKTYTFRVVFMTWDQRVINAFSETEAIILAQAEQIKAERSYIVNFVELIK